MLVGGVDTVAAKLDALCGPDGLDGVVAMLPADAGDPQGPASGRRRRSVPPGCSTDPRGSP